MPIVLTAALAITPLETIAGPVLVMEDGVITRLGPRSSVEIPTGAQVLDFPGAVLAPGFIDLHIHGSAGYDVMDAGPSALAAIESFLAKHGVTSYCPTTVTAPIDATLRALERLGAAAKSPAQSGRAHPVGIHLEGPFISAAKCGVHPVLDIQPPSVSLFENLHSTAAGHVRMMTVAPELPGAGDLIRAAVARGVRVSLGHSDALTAPARAAVAAGASHATHTFNAMRPLDHREPGILGLVLSDDRLSADIICDGVHLAPETVRLFLATKGGDRAVLITDAISATGMPDGVYRLGNFEVQVKGSTCLSHGKLAGSVLTMDLAVRNVMSIAQWSLASAVRLATLNPARVLGMEKKVGSLSPGLAADINILSPTGNIIRTFIAGA